MYLTLPYTVNQSHNWYANWPGAWYSDVETMDNSASDSLPTYIQLY